MPNYQEAVNSAVVVKAGTADEAVIRGINKLGLPDFIRETQKAQEFRTDIDVEFTTSAGFGRITFGGLMVPDDTTGQDIVKGYWLANTKITDMRLYYNNDDFVACDLANDANSCFQVVKFGDRQADKSGLYPLAVEMTCGGRIATFNKHMTDVATPTMNFPAGGTTITDSGNGFVTAGFAVGQTLIIEGSTSNDGQYLITGVAAGTITCAGATFTTEASIEGCTLHGGKL